MAAPRPTRAQPRCAPIIIPFIAGQWSLPLFGLRYWIYPTSFQSPSLRGSGRFISSLVPVIAVIILFQSPSLRGSGRFMEQGHGPLRSKLVSIPFIAGQWSLPESRGAPSRSARCFNPLHCGAVVASHPTVPPGRQALLFQSPSLRGSGRFVMRRSSSGFYPHWFQSPSLRGSGRFQGGPPHGSRSHHVSIPFIAGQWSLLSGSVSGGTTSTDRFNPLHCGAVVASGIAYTGGAGFHLVSIPFIAGQWSLRHVPPPLDDDAALVSIPFIAGQWSLRFDALMEHVDLLMFQSPSLRGSGRFTTLTADAYGESAEFQSPSLRGSGRFNLKTSPNWIRPPGFQSPSLRGSGRFAGHGPGAVQATRVSIPFIAGQWSLPLAARRGRARREKVSIPFIAGQWSLPYGGRGALRSRRVVSIPFIAGQWSLPGDRRLRRRVGGVSIPFIAGQWSLPPRRGGEPFAFPVSIPFIAGQWSLLERPLAARRGARRFQSPSLRGSGRFS